jgi:hypothetical protein
MREATPTIVAAGRISPKMSPWTADTAADPAMSTTKILVRTTSCSENPPSPSARSMIAKIVRACAAMSPGCCEVPSGPASVVPATQQPSPTTIARL